MKIDLTADTGNLLNSLNDLVEARLSSKEDFVTKYIAIRQRELNNLKNMNVDEVYEYIKKTAVKAQAPKFCPNCDCDLD